MGEFLSMGKELVHLFLVLCKNKGRLDAVEAGDQFFGHRRGEQRHRNGPQSLGSELCKEPFRMVV